jgi:hypothetical protein
MRKLFIFIVPFALTGCIYQAVSAYDIERATKHCGSLENVVEIRADAFGGENVLCKGKISEPLSP